MAWRRKIEHVIVSRCACQSADWLGMAAEYAKPGIREDAWFLCYGRYLLWITQ